MEIVTKIENQPRNGMDKPNKACVIKESGEL